MESNETIGQTIGRQASKKGRVHRILAHSYTVYFIFLLISVLLDFVFQFKIFTSPIMIPTGVALLILASFLIIWAQYSSRKINTENVTKETFCRGPYCY